MVNEELIKKAKQSLYSVPSTATQTKSTGKSIREILVEYEEEKKRKAEEEERKKKEAEAKAKKEKLESAVKGGLTSTLYTLATSAISPALTSLLKQDTAKKMEDIVKKEAGKATSTLKEVVTKPLSKEKETIQLPKTITKRLEGDVEGLKYAGAKLQEGLINIPKNIGTLSMLASEKAGQISPLVPLIEAVTGDKELYEKKTKKAEELWGKQKTFYQEAIDKLNKKADVSKVGTVEKFMGDVLASMPQMALNFVPGIGPALFAISAGGGYAEQATQAGATKDQQLLYGALGGIAEVTLEHILGVVPGLKKLLKGEVKKPGIHVLKEMLGEFIEEASIDPVMGFAEKYIYNPDKKWVGENGVIDWKQATTEGLAGATMALLLSALAMPVGSIAREKAEKIVKSGEEAKPLQINSLAKTYAEEVKQYEKEYGTAPRVPTIDEQVRAMQNLVEDLRYQRLYLGVNNTAEIEAAERTLLRLQKEQNKSNIEKQIAYLEKIQEELFKENRWQTPEFGKISDQIRMLRGVLAEIQQPAQQAQPVAAQQVQQIQPTTAQLGEQVAQRITPERGIGITEEVPTDINAVLQQYKELQEKQAQQQKQQQEQQQKEGIQPIKEEIQPIKTEMPQGEAEQEIEARAAATTEIATEPLQEKTSIPEAQETKPQGQQPDINKAEKIEQVEETKEKLKREVSEADLRGLSKKQQKIYKYIMNIPDDINVKRLVEKFKIRSTETSKGFDYSQKESFAEELIKGFLGRGEIKDDTYIAFNIPRDGTFEIVNNAKNIAVLLDKLGLDADNLPTIENKEISQFELDPIVKKTAKEENYIITAEMQTDNKPSYYYVYGNGAVLKVIDKQNYDYIKKNYKNSLDKSHSDLLKEVLRKGQNTTTLLNDKATVTTFEYGGDKRIVYELGGRRMEYNHKFVKDYEKKGNRFYFDDDGFLVIKDNDGNLISVILPYSIAKSKTGEEINKLIDGEYWNRLSLRKKQGQNKQEPKTEKPEAKEYTEARKKPGAQTYIGGESALIRNLANNMQPQGVIKLSEIEKFVSENLDVPVNYGKFRQRAKGIYKQHWQTIRLKKANDIETLFHEVGHFLDDKLYFTKGNYNSELMALGLPASRPSYSNQQVLNEGLAEFVRYYSVDKNMAKQKAPAFYKHFEEVIGKQPNLDKFFDLINAAVKNYTSMSATEIIESQISYDMPKKKKITLKDLYTAFIDELYPLYDTVNKITGGKSINPSENPYYYARLLAGTGKKAWGYLKYGIRLDTGEKVTRGLEEILEPVKDNIKTFINYAAAKRAIELSERGIETGISRQIAEQTLQEQEANKKVFDDVLNELYEFQDRLLDKLVGGILSDKQKAFIKALNKHYIPFYRVIDTFVEKKGTGQGYEIGAAIHKIIGSTREIINPLESIVKNVYYFTTLADKNKVGLSLINLARKYEGSGKILEAVPPNIIAQKLKLSQISKQLKDLGVDISNIDLNETLTFFTPGAYSKLENIITVYENGKPKYFEVHDEALFRVFEGMNRHTADWLKIISAPTRLIRAGIVLNPDYMVRNPIRDSFMAAVISKTGFIPGYDSVKGLLHVLKKDEVYQQFINSGAASSAFVSMDREYAQESLRDLLSSDLKKKTLNIITHPIEILRALSEFSEEATRVRVFEKGLKKYGKQYQDVIDVMMEAAMATREGSIDFSRGGYVSKGYNKVNAFFNSALQGVDTIVRRFVDDPVGSFLKATLFVTLPSIILWFINKDDKRYQELPQYQKDLYWIIPTKERLYRIPKPFELGMAFGSLAERVLNAIVEQDPNAFDGYTEQLWDVLAPDLLIDLFMPAIEAYSNYDFFRNQKIVPFAEEFLEKPDQYSIYTSETAKLISKTFGWSPRIIEHLILGYCGGIANYGLGVTDEMLKFIGIAEKPVEPSKDFIYKIPGLRTLAIEPYLRGSDSLNRLYTEKSELTQKQRSAKKNNQPFPIKDQNRLKKINEAVDKIAALRKRGTNIYNSKNLTAEQKQKLLEQITLQQINIARKVLGEEPIKTEQSK